LWEVLRDYNIDEPPIKIIKALYEDGTSVVLENNHLGEFFRTTWMSTFPSPVQRLTENIMQGALTNYDSSISINGRTICNLRFADDFDLMAGSTEEHQDLSTRVERSRSWYGGQHLEEQREGVNTPISMGGNLLGDVDHFKYLGSILNKDVTSTQEIKTRIAQAIAAMTRLHPILQIKNISLQVKIRLNRPIVISIFLYDCDSWTTTAETASKPS